MKARKGVFRFLWVTDPWDTLDHERDTTLRLIEESVALGLESNWCDAGSIGLTGGGVRLGCRQVLAVHHGRGSRAFELGPEKEADPRQFSSIQYRADPPIDLKYLQPLQLLALECEAKITNPPSILMMANEKCEASLLGELMPPTIVTCSWALMSAFGNSEGSVVLKPLNEAQSKGVYLLDFRDSKTAIEAKSRLKDSSNGFTRLVLLQRFLPGISDGEQRLWFVDGKLLAHARKVPKAGEFKINMDGGSTLIKSELSAGDKKAAFRIGRHLKSRKIRLAAVDLIDGFVTDFNFTSPGLLVQMEELLGLNLARKVVEALVSDILF